MGIDKKIGRLLFSICDMIRLDTRSIDESRQVAKRQNTLG